MLECTGDDMKRFCFVIFLTLTSGASFAESKDCQLFTVQAASCIRVPTSKFEALEAGTPLPETAQMVMNPTYYGLPAVDGAYRYYVIERHVYRVSSRSLEIIDHVGRADRRLW